MEITQEDIIRAFGINDCTKYKTEKICSKAVIQAFSGVPDIDMNEITHVLHNLGDGSDIAMIDLMKFVE